MGARLAAVLAALVLMACDPAPKGTFTILSGSENKSLAPVVQAFCAEEGWTCAMDYQGSVDIRLALAGEARPADAVWPAHSRWIEMGDDRRRVKHAASIMQSPVVFAVAEPLAAELGLKDRPVTWAELVDLVAAGRLPFLMTSATQSNSGFSAYVAMLTALAGAGEVLTPEDLADPALKDKVKTLLAGVQRTAGSSGWLKDLYLEGAPSGAYDAMVNYEVMVIEANETLTEAGLPPLYALYPADGVALADSPLGYVSGAPDDAEREAFFLKLQDHLLSPDVQAEIAESGRRTGVAMTDADPTVFRPEWGIDVDRVLPAIRFPGPPVLAEALDLYQEVLRKPSLTALCLDFSGSMEGMGAAQLKAALERMVDPETARRFMIQPTAEDVVLFLPFSSAPWGVGVAKGPAAIRDEVADIAALTPQGGTDIYGCAAAALAEIAKRPEGATHQRAIVLFTDGKSKGDPLTFIRPYSQGGHDIPVYSLTFGAADPAQLKELADLTRGRVFDGRHDLARAFRQVRGYN